LAAKLKLAAFQFQQYGMVQGKVIHVNVDASEAPSPNIHEVGRERLTGPSPVQKGVPRSRARAVTGL
jgi:hypothetical protein